MRPWIGLVCVIAAVVLVEALGIGLVGGAIGVAAGFGGARLALASVRFTVASVVRGIPASDIRFDPQLAAVQGTVLDRSGSVVDGRGIEFDQTGRMFAGFHDRVPRADCRGH